MSPVGSTAASSPLALALNRRNACAEIYLLLNSERIDSQMAEKMIEQQEGSLETWNKFLTKGHKIAELI